MDPLTLTAASGMRARMESLELLANNVANTDTSGYKTDREFYNLYLSPEVNDTGDPATMPVIEKNYTDYSQGTLRVTSNPLDFGIQGRGFFAVDSPAGVAYTRSGAFQLSRSGTLVTQDGYSVRGAAGKPIQVDPSLPFTVTPDGAITQSGNAVGQLPVYDFVNPGDLVKQGNTLFHPADPNTKPAAAQADVRQGQLEGSNVGNAESAVRLVSVMRQFEMLQRAVHIGMEMNRKAIDEVARVGS